MATRDHTAGAKGPSQVLVIRGSEGREEEEMLLQLKCVLEITDIITFL